jgi:hypothetical protein
LRKDTRGRVVVTAERRAGLLEQFDQSGTSGIQFAKLAGVEYSTFAYWLHPLIANWFLRPIGHLYASMVCVPHSTILTGDFSRSAGVVSVVASISYDTYHAD